MDIRKGRDQYVPGKHSNFHMQHSRLQPRQYQDTMPKIQHFTPKSQGCGYHWQDRGSLPCLWLPYTLYRRPKEKINSPETSTSFITTRRRAIVRKIYLSPDDTSALWGGITEVQNWGNLCHNPSCMAVKHTKSITGSNLPFRAYIILPGSLILHPFPILF